jgi:hypothetical protein
MPHPLVNQLRFTRSEWVRGLDGITADEAGRHFEPINSIGWMVGHLAWHEQMYWLQRAQGKTLVAEVMQCANGAERCDPPLDEMWAAWRAITQESDAYLDTLTPELLQTHFMVDGKPHRESIGTNLHRITYHYWFHLGEAQAIRQLLGHVDLPQFVGSISRVPYTPEPGA